MLFRSISVALSANSSSFVSQMRAAGAAVDNFHKQASAGADKTVVSSAAASKALSQLGVIAATVVVAGLLSSVKAAAQFEAVMRNVNSISRLSEIQFKAQGQAVIDLSTKLPQTAKILAEGLYEIASSGFQGAEGLVVLEKSARAASAGLTTTDNAAKAITAVLNRSEERRVGKECRL